MRCDVHGTSRHVTMKSSIRELCAFYKSGAYARESSESYPGRSAWCSSQVWLKYCGTALETRRQTEKTDISLKPEELRLLRESLTVMQKSAEGIVGG